MLRFRVYVNGQRLPDTVQIPSLQRCYDCAVVQMDKAKSKDHGSLSLSRHLSTKVQSIQMVLPLGANSVFDSLEAKAGGFALRIVQVEEVDIDGDGQADNVRELVEWTIDCAVVVNREFNLGSGHDVLLLQTASYLKKKILEVPA